MKVAIGFEAKGTVDVQYGAYRLQVAEWAGIHPSEVTGEDVARFEAEQEGRQP